jgi:hypothetical protein
MDVAYVSGLAALAGAAIGGLTSFGSSWFTQHAQARAQQRALIVTRRQDLYRDFIEESSRLYADALFHDTPDAAELIRLYVMVSRMRVLSSPDIVGLADGVARMVLDTYFAPNKSFSEIHHMANTGNLDPLRAFSEACREEFRDAGYL